MYDLKTKIRSEGIIEEGYNDLLLTKIIRFKNSYEGQIEKYLNKIYCTDKDLKLFWAKLYDDLYEVDKIMLDWYFDEAESIFEKLSQDMLVSDITEKSYLQVKGIIEGLEEIFDILWNRNTKDKMDAIYNWIMDVPYLLLTKIEQIGVTKKIKIQEDIDFDIKYNQNSYENFDEMLEGDKIFAA